VYTMDGCTSVDVIIVATITLYCSLVKDLQQQQVFAFLPLRSYGFRFIVQGDFDLPSSRECVTSDSSWNQWLREQIPNLFLQALLDMRVRLKTTRTNKQTKTNKQVFSEKLALLYRRLSIKKMT